MGLTALHHGAVVVVVSLVLACGGETSKGGDDTAETALPKLREKAEAGDMSAQMQVGGMITSWRRRGRYWNM